MKTPSEKIKEGVDALELEIKYSRDTLRVFREKFKTESNCEALDKISYLFQEILGMYGDSVKYPQLALSNTHKKRLERMMKYINLKNL